MRSSIITVTKFEIIRQLKKPSFWISLLLFPLGIVILFGLSVLNGGNPNSLGGKVSDQSHFGITDVAGIVNSPTLKLPCCPDQVREVETQASSAPLALSFRPYNSKEEGLAALKKGEIEAYYYLPAEFKQSLRVEVFVIAKRENIFGAQKYQAPIRSLLTESATKGIDPIKLSIITNSYAIHTNTIDQASGAEVNLFGEAILPLSILAIFYLLIVVFGNRLLMSVVEEKENRVSEMILTAVSARHLIIGKLVAMMLLGFLQVSFILIPAISMLIYHRDNPAVSSVLASVEINPVTIITNLALLLMSYFFFAGICTFVGSLTPTARESSQYMGVAIMGVMLPFFFMNALLTSEPNQITYFLTYFPLSSPIALMLRNAFGGLPFHELLAGLAVITLYATLSTHFAVRSFEKYAINFSLVRPNFAPRKTWKKLSKKS